MLTFSIKTKPVQNDGKSVIKDYSGLRDWEVMERVKKFDPKAVEEAKRRGIYKEPSKDNAKDWPKEYSCNFLEAGVVSYTDVGQGVAYLRKETIAAMCASFIGKPVLIDHHDVTPKTFERKAVGYVTKTWFNEQDGWFWCTFIVTDDKAKELIAKGYSVSCAFDVIATAAGGEWHNVKYDEELTECSFTHLAIVSSPRYEACKIYMNSKGMGTMKKENALCPECGEAMKKEGGKLVCPNCGKKANAKQGRITQDGDFFFVEILDENGKQISKSEACDTKDEASKKLRIMLDGMTNELIRPAAVGDEVLVQKNGNQIQCVVLEVLGDFIKVQPKGGAHHFLVEAAAADFDDDTIELVGEVENDKDDLFEIVERDRYMNKRVFTP